MLSGMLNANFRLLRQARECLTVNKIYRSVQPLGLWEDVLFLEFVEGLTLGDKIAIRRSQPGELFSTLENVGKLLSRLHLNSIKQNSAPDFGLAADYAHKIVDNLVKHGVLQNHPRVQSALGRLIEKWTTEMLQPLILFFPLKVVLWPLIGSAVNLLTQQLTWVV